MATLNAVRSTSVPRIFILLPLLKANLYFSYEHALSKVESDFIEEKKKGEGRGGAEGRERRGEEEEGCEGAREEGRIKFCFPFLSPSPVDANYSVKMHLRA